MPAARARRPLQQFLDTTTTKFSFSGGKPGLISNDYVSDFGHPPIVPSHHSAFHGLTEQQCELVIQEIAPPEAIATGQKGGPCIR